MAEITVVEITAPAVTARVELTYRWYVPGNDPWRRIAGASNSIPAGGDWENRAIQGGSSEVRLYTPSEGLVMKFLNFTRVRVGSTGQGEFHASGYLIQQYTNFDWEVISIRK